MNDAPPQSGTYLEIDRTAFESNIAELRKELGSAEMSMVVKGNAYGHGYKPMIGLAEAAGVRHFAVFSAREAAGVLRASDGKSRLMIMGHAEPENLPWLLEHGVEVWLNDIDAWERTKKVLATQGGNAKVHLELETGMYRTGIIEENAMIAAREIAAHPNVELVGICTHLAGREASENNERVAQQKDVFWRVVRRLEDEGIRPEFRHMASSAAALLDDDCRLDLCRVGIACYGLWPSPEVRQIRESRPDSPVFRNVMTWHSTVLATQDVPRGAYVGYGNSYQADRDMELAIVGVGYADGFARALSNLGHVLIQGHRAPIIGKVNMNMVQVDITDVPGAQVGDDVVLIGRQGDVEISVASFSDFNNIVNYELMARISHELPRLVQTPKRLSEPLE